MRPPGPAMIRKVQRSMGRSPFGQVVGRWVGGVEAGAVRWCQGPGRAIHAQGELDGFGGQAQQLGQPVDQELGLAPGAATCRSIGRTVSVMKRPKSATKADAMTLPSLGVAQGHALDHDDRVRSRRGSPPVRVRCLIVCHLVVVGRNGPLMKPSVDDPAVVSC